MSQATEMLAAYIAAETAILQGKEVRFGDRFVKMEDLEYIQRGRREWQQKVVAEQSTAAGIPTLGGARVRLANFANAE